MPNVGITKCEFLTKIDKRAFYKKIIYMTLNEK